MGAKDSVKFNLRRATFKCGACPQKFLSSNAVARHTDAAHKVTSKVQKANELNTLLGKSVKPIATKKQPVSTKKVDQAVIGSEAEPARVMDFRKIEYECPQCYQCFAVYFSAFKHIQKRHCINSQGIKVSPDSSELIKPVRVEVCMKCNQRLQSIDPHTCKDVFTNIDPMATYICTGCKQKFDSLNLFDMHVATWHSGLHSDNIETLFFPNRDELNLWKQDVESQTKIRYLLLDGKDSSKQIYHCTHLSSGDSNEDNVVHFCPSSIFVRDFTKSIQVHFYKQHFGHDCKYKLPAKYNKYKIKHIVKETAEQNRLHADFKTLMDVIVEESKKCDKVTLDTLHKKAQEMLSIVNNCNEAPKGNKRNMTDDQISETLESMDVKRKRKDISVEDKKPVTGPELDELDLITSPAVTSSNEQRLLRKPKIKNVNTSPFVISSPSSSKSSFNDSYKEFVDKNMKALADAQAEAVVKQKYGKTYSKNIENQTKPSSPVKNIENQTKPSSPVKNIENQTKPSAPVKNIENQTKPSSPAPKVVSKPNSVKTKKKIVKTKIGQFKPSLSPKKVEKEVSVSSIDNRRSSIGKIDFEYEVIQQENDCNILVLKI